MTNKSTFSQIKVKMSAFKKNKSIFQRLSPHQYILLFIFLFAVFLRVLGSNPGHAINNADEQSIMFQIYNIALNNNFEPADYYYGSLLGYLYSFFHVKLFIPIFHIFSFIKNNFQPITDNWYYFFDHNYYFNYWARYESAILNSFTIIVIYLLGKKLFNKEIGLIAAFLTAVNYRVVLSSPLVLADAPAALFAALSLLLSVSILKNKSLRSYIYAAVGIALALSVKYFVYILPAFILCHIFSVWSASKDSLLIKFRKIIFNKNLFITIFLSIAIFLLINPYLVIKSNIVLEQFAWGTSNYNVNPGKISFLGANSSFYPLYYLWNYGLGKLLSIVTLLGMLYGLIRYAKISFILLSVILPFFYMFVVLSGSLGSVHNFSSIIPIVLIFPALVIYKVSKIISGKVFFPLILVILTFASGFASLKSSLLSSLYYSKPQNIYTVNEWIDRNIKQNSNVIFIDPVREKNLTIQDLQEAKADYAIVNSDHNVYFNDQLTKNNEFMRKTFFNDNLFWSLMNNTYISLLTKELGDYRIKTIVKPFWESTEASFFVIKIPQSNNNYEDILVNTYNFTVEDKEKHWTINSSLGENSKVYRASEAQGYDGINGIYITANICAIQTVISAENFPVEKSKWYTVLGWFRHEGNFLPNSRDGFLRLDFYSSDNSLIKTYVSGQLNSNLWTKLQASGLAPDNSAYAKASFQIDRCFKENEYIFNKIELFLSQNKFEINKSDYPYYNVELPKNFIWTPGKYL